MTMRAILVDEASKKNADALYVGDTQAPDLKEGEALVSLKAFGLNRMDILQRKGNYPLPPGASSILGVEYSGVVETPAGDLKKGQQVFGLTAGGCYGSKVAVRPELTWTKPESLSHEEAAAIPENWLTAYQTAIQIGQLKKNESILIHAGASGVGTSAIQLARLFKASNVFATAGTAEKCQFLTSHLGATKAYNYKEEDWAQEILNATDSKGVDVVLDFVGQAYWENNLKVLARDGRLVVIGLLSGAETSKPLNMGPLLFKRLRIEGTTLRSRTVEYQALLMKNFERDALSAIVGKKAGSHREGGMDLVIHKVYKASEIVEALSTMTEAEIVPYWQTGKGIAPVKPEFVLFDRLKSHTTKPDDDAAEGRTLEVSKEDGERPAKRAKLEKKGGQNSARDRKKGRGPRVSFAKQLCTSIAKGNPECLRLKNGQVCKFSHDLKDYLATKNPDLELPSIDGLVEFYPSEPPKLLSKQCPAFENLGVCPFGWKCRFLQSHVEPTSNGLDRQLSYNQAKMQLAVSLINSGQPNRTLPFDQAKELLSATRGEKNLVRSEQQRLFRGQREVSFPQSIAYFQKIGDPWTQNDNYHNSKRTKNNKESKAAEPGTAPAPDVVDSNSQEVLDDPDGHPESDDIQIIMDSTTTSLNIDREKEARATPVFDVRNKLYLAPLTTTGNLPFRRLCVQYGADITCSEMGLANEFLSGNPSEWSLVRRHASEKLFGVQIAGGRPTQLVPAAEAITRACVDIDFIDVNCGCPIDLVFNKGAGSALLLNAGRLAKSLKGMRDVLGQIPLTVKMRMGVKDGENVAHRLAVRASKEWSVSAVTLHGRNRNQRYSRSADYDYIASCIRQLRAMEEAEDLQRMPFIGNGDAYDPLQYWNTIEKTGVDTIMIARGALIKPWIFTELKERRLWDISARERLEGIRDLVDYGLEHWGSDDIGIRETRRFVCEALSFQHRYVPVGLLERPMQMNERPYPYKGRNELETLLSSPDAQDWQKISDMFLGKPDQAFAFVPKHKSNAYEAQG